MNLLVFHSNKICWIIAMYEVIDDFFPLYIGEFQVIQILFDDVNGVSFNKIASLLSNPFYSKCLIFQIIQLWSSEFRFSILYPYIISFLQTRIKLFIWILFTVNKIYTTFLITSWIFSMENDFFETSSLDRTVPNSVFDNFNHNAWLHWNRTSP